ncbi:DUF3761 domain-containing protein [Amycolatopsis echigonensis]|uniref:DUF3761 domain-containing protein n=1 Tax=Amycolatopsis echigonensis TaxID=2576905 RepID=A0A8E1W4D6_9PSEU|nr:DUF3761 domain-containing protein [Amycolatopsis echigonensis]MBB2503465.1 DUF3761 domain-containing protein [Amycolatopsis echigonensis]
MLRKLGMALAAGVLVAGCGAAPAGNAPSAVTSEYSPPPTTSSAPETSATPTTPATSIAAPVTDPPTTVAKPKTQAAPRTTTSQADASDQAAPDPGPADCGSDYYRNSSGNCVHRPDSSPSGATAQCNDGSYSYSQHRSGTCSRHGGVKQWL